MLYVLILQKSGGGYPLIKTTESNDNFLRSFSWQIQLISEFLPEIRWEIEFVFNF